MVDDLSTESVSMFGLVRSIRAQVAARAYMRLRGESGLLSAASDVVELCPPEILEGPPIKLLSGQLERVTQSPFSAPHEDAIAIALGAPRHTQSTTMYMFKDVTVAKRWVIAANRHEEFCWPQSEWTFSRPKMIDKAALADSVQGSRFFGHWLRDDCATNLILPVDVPLIRPVRQKWTDEDFYSEALELRPAINIAHAHIAELTYVEDLANNSHKLKRLQTHRVSIRQKMKSQNPGDIVYISRGPSARGRVIDNEAQLIEHLKSAGVKIVLAEQMNSASFVNEIFDASLIISAEGSQCAHAIYALKDGAAGLLTLQPHDRFWLPHLEWTRLFGLKFGAVISRPDRGKFWIDPSEVLRTIDLF